MDKIKKGLGRGLSSLIGETRVEVQKNLLPVSDLVPNKYQPRKKFKDTRVLCFFLVVQVCKKILFHQMLSNFTCYEKQNNTMSSIQFISKGQKIEPN